MHIGDYVSNVMNETDSDSMILYGIYSKSMTNSLLIQEWGGINPEDTEKLKGPWKLPNKD